MPEAKAPPLVVTAQVHGFLRLIQKSRSLLIITINILIYLSKILNIVKVGSIYNDKFTGQELSEYLIYGRHLAGHTCEQFRVRDCWLVVAGISTLLSRAEW